MLLRCCCSLALLFGSWLLPAQVTQVDPAASALTFSIRNAGVNVTGRFAEFAVSLYFSPEELGRSYLEATLQANSIDTGIDLRDEHLQKEKYFDADKYPALRFRSQQIRREGSGFLAVGTLTIKGKSQPVELPFSFDGKTFRATYELNRLDYGVGSSSWVLDDTVRITLQVVARST